MRNVDATDPIVSAEYKLLPMLELDELELGARVAAAFALDSLQPYHSLRMSINEPRLNA